MQKDEVRCSLKALDETKIFIFFDSLLKITKAAVAIIDLKPHFDKV